MNLYLTFDGTLKYQQIFKLENNYLVKYLLQVTNGRNKKFMMTVKQFIDQQPYEYDKDTQLKVTGYLEENVYKKDDEWVSTGIEVIADIVSEVKDDKK